MIRTCARVTRGGYVALALGLGCGMWQAVDGPGAGDGEHPVLRLAWERWAWAWRSASPPRRTGT